MSGDTETRAIRQLPLLDQENRAFWTGGKDGALLIQRCAACRRYIHPPRPRCHCCGSADVASKAVSGQGVVKTFSVNVQQWMPGLRVPFVLAAVELVEQDRLYVLTNIVGCPVDQVRPGMPVSVEFEQVEDVWVPLFHPTEQEA